MIARSMHLFKFEACRYVHGKCGRKKLQAKTTSSPMVHYILLYSILGCSADRICIYIKLSTYIYIYIPACRPDAVQVHPRDFLREEPYECAQQVPSILLHRKMINIYTVQ